MDRQGTTCSKPIIRFHLSFHFNHCLPICNGPISETVKEYVNQIEMNGHEQRSVMKFFFLGGKRYKAIHTKLKAVLGEDAVCLAPVKHCCQRFKQGDLSLDDEFRAG
jgi:hypothetical protein